MPDVLATSHAWPALSLSGVPAAEAAADLARELRTRVLGERFADDGWCDLRRMVVAGGFCVVSRVFARDGGGHEALLVPWSDGSFRILVDPFPPGAQAVTRDLIERRNRFRIAHEIAHSFFYDRKCAPAQRLVPGSPEEELFCDHFASALLVPPCAARAAAMEPETMFDLHQRFQVSVEAAARAFARAHPEACVIGLMWAPSPAGRPAHRIVWKAGTQFVPKGARLSPLVDAAALEGRAVGTEKLGVGELRGEFRIAAARMAGRRQVVALVVPAAGTQGAAYRTGQATFPM
jgi:hypothetical protein